MNLLNASVFTIMDIQGGHRGCARLNLNKSIFIKQTNVTFPLVPEQIIDNLQFFRVLTGQPIQLRNRFEGSAHIFLLSKMEKEPNDIYD